MRVEGSIPKTTPPPIQDTVTLVTMALAFISEMVVVSSILNDVLLINYLEKSVRLRDTFAGKRISETRGEKTVSEGLSELYRQKCRTGVRTKLLFFILRIHHFMEMTWFSRTYYLNSRPPN